jgi:AraC-like DNA-binding protein
LIRATQLLPELADVIPLLERARHGIEFFGFEEQADEAFQRIKSSRGLRRIAAFLEFLDELARCNDYRLLSTAQLRSTEDALSIDRINRVVELITQDPASAPTLVELAEQFGMSQSAFSRFFRKETGNTFTDFVNRIKISRACQLLMETDLYVSNICYQVGFNNLANFNRRFIAFKGVTPSEFRRKSVERFGS